MNRAFSLIELMIVIAIVAVLAAIAVPSYNTYATKARISAFWPIVENVKQRSIEYYSRNGVWPNATQLGFSATDNLSLDDPESLNQYFTAFSITPITTGACSASVLLVSWTIDHDAVGINNATTYVGSMYISQMSTGSHVSTMCRETLDGVSFGHTYIGNVCAYSDLASFNTAICM